MPQLQTLAILEPRPNQGYRLACGLAQLLRNTRRDVCILDLDPACELSTRLLPRRDASWNPGQASTTALAWLHAAIEGRDDSLTPPPVWTPVPGTKRIQVIGGMLHADRLYQRIPEVIARTGGLDGPAAWLDRFLAERCTNVDVVLLLAGAGLGWSARLAAALAPDVLVWLRHDAWQGHDVAAAAEVVGASRGVPDAPGGARQLYLYNGTGLARPPALREGEITRYPVVLPETDPFSWTLEDLAPLRQYIDPLQGIVRTSG